MEPVDEALLELVDVADQHRGEVGVAEVRGAVLGSASKSSIRRFVITEKAPTRASPGFTFKTLLRHYAKRVFTAHLVDVKLDTQHNYHKGLQLYDTPACLKTSLPFSPVT